jgi:hypothetical protein
MCAGFHVVQKLHSVGVKTITAIDVFMGADDVVLLKHGAVFATYVLLI